MDVKKIVLLVGALHHRGGHRLHGQEHVHRRLARRRRRPARSFRPGPRCWSRPAPCRSARSSTPRPSATSPGRRAWSSPLISSRGEGGADPQSLIGTVVRNEITAGQPVTQGALVTSRRARLPRRGARPGHARRHRRRVRDQRRRRLRLPGRPGRPGADPGGRGRRRRRAAQRLRDDHPQHPRARRRPAPQRARRGGQPGRPDRLDRDVRGDAEDRREDRGRADHRPALAVAALARRQQCRAGARHRLRRGPGARRTAIRSAERQMLLAIASRPIDTNPTYTVGADVSRFQRSTVPGRAASDNRQCAGGGPPPASIRRPAASARSSASPAATMSRSFRWEHR